MLEKNVPNKDISAPRAKRLKVALSLINISAAAFAKKYALNSHTLNAWKSGTRTLSTKGAYNIAQALKQEGWHCSPDWLLGGKGIAPVPIEDINTKTTSIIPESDYEVPASLSEDFQITKEATFFRHLHPQSTCLLLDDDGMAPLYKKGDLVAGLPIKPDEYEKVIGVPCIVKLKKLGSLCRILQKTSEPGIYQLCVLDLTTAVANPVIQNPKIESLAPILWCRRPLSNITSMTVE